MSTLSGGPNIITDGLVLYLDAGNTYSYTSGSTVWNDLSRSQTNGTLVNGPTFTGSNGGAIVFDGTNDYVTGSCSLVNANSGSCFSLWVKTPSTSIQIIAAYSSGINNGFRFQIYSNTLNYTLGNVADYNTSVNISDNNWKNIVASTSGSTCLVYVNGTLVSTISIGNMQGTTSDFKLGAYFDNQYFFIGSIANSQLYNRALTASEVLQNYNATKGRFGL